MTLKQADTKKIKKSNNPAYPGSGNKMYIIPVGILMMLMKYIASHGE